MLANPEILPLMFNLVWRTSNRLATNSRIANVRIGLLSPSLSGRDDPTVSAMDKGTA